MMPREAIGYVLLALLLGTIVVILVRRRRAFRKEWMRRWGCPPPRGRIWR